MQLFIDSADMDEIKQAASWGVIDGVTTNPSLIAKSGRKFADVVKEICDVIDGPISAECLATQYDAMLLEARQIATIHANIVVKVPLTVDGIRCVKTLADEGIKTNVTLCFSAAQGLLAAKAGATYISPFVGRLDDNCHEGMQVVEELVTIYAQHGWATQVLTASVRSPRHVVKAAVCGSHVATLPFGVLKQLFLHPLTDVGLARFLADAGVR